MTENGEHLSTGIDDEPPKLKRATRRLSLPLIAPEADGELNITEHYAQQISKEISWRLAEAVAAKDEAIEEPYQFLFETVEKYERAQLKRRQEILQRGAVRLTLAALLVAAISGLRGPGLLPYEVTLSLSCAFLTGLVIFMAIIALGNDSQDYFLFPPSQLAEEKKEALNVLRGLLLNMGMKLSPEEKKKLMHLIRDKTRPQRHAFRTYLIEKNEEQEALAAKKRDQDEAAFQARLQEKKDEEAAEEAQRLLTEREINAVNRR